VDDKPAQNRKNSNNKRGFTRPMPIETQVPSTIDVPSMDKEEESNPGDSGDSTATSSMDSDAQIRRLTEKLNDLEGRLDEEKEKKRKLTRMIERSQKRVKTLQKAMSSSMRQTTGKSNGVKTSSKMTLKELESGYGNSAKNVVAEAVRLFRGKVLVLNKFLSTNWQEYNEDKQGSLCQALMKKVKTKDLNDRSIIWSLHLVPVLKSTLHTYRNKITKMIKEQFEGEYVQVSIDMRL
jgi:hypothetical protein